VIRPEEFRDACLGEDTTITLRIFPGMNPWEQDVVAEALKAALKRKK